MKKYLKLKNFLFLFLFLFIFLGSNAQAQEKRATSTKSPDLNPLGNLQVKIPGIEALAEKYPIICTDNGDKETCKIPWIAVYIYAIYNYLLGIGGVLAAIALMIGGVIWLISAGNASRVSEAKSWIVGSITGIIILLTSYVLLYEINPELVNTRYVDLQTIDPISIEAEQTPPLDLSNLTGSIYPINDWQTIPSHPNIINQAADQKANPLLANALLKVADCMSLSGYKLRISSLSRTPQKQAELYSKSYNHSPNKCGTLKKAEGTTKGGTTTCCPFPADGKIKLCPHTSGSAVDAWGSDPKSNHSNKKSTASQYKLQECMFASGFCIIPSECWHFELPALSKPCNQVKNLESGGGDSCQDLKNGKY